MIKNVIEFKLIIILSAMFILSTFMSCEKAEENNISNNESVALTKSIIDEVDPVLIDTW